MRAREHYFFLKSLVALALICLCLIAAQWQYHRGIDRHARNSMIEANIAAPIITLTSAQSVQLAHLMLVKLFCYGTDTLKVSMVLNFLPSLKLLAEQSSGLIAVG